MLTKCSIFVLSLICLSALVEAHNDGQVLKPPMGWLSWLRYQTIDCKTYPDGCINEHLYKAQADRMAADGYKVLGYEYVMIDDKWSEMSRDSNHRLVPNRERFPNGIKGLADYVHSKGLKLGVYGDVGPTTCAGYPAQGGNGSNFFATDAKTFTEWDVDSFKLDICHQDSKTFDDLFPKMGDALNASGRHIMFSCEWPLGQYFRNPRIEPNYELIAKTCHIYRNFHDAGDSWSSISDVINFYGSQNNLFIKHNGPGHFYDPDMLAIGDFGLSYEQSKTQMAMWSMWSSPLLMSNDLRQLKPEFKNILQNKDVIAVNQDALCKMAKLHSKVDSGWRGTSKQLWVKELSSKVNGNASYAIVYLNTYDSGDIDIMSAKVSDLLPDAVKGTEYSVHDLFRDEGKDVLFTVKTDDQLSLKVAPGGGCRMVKLVPE